MQRYSFSLTVDSSPPVSINICADNYILPQNECFFRTALLPLPENDPTENDRKVFR